LHRWSKYPDRFPELARDLIRLKVDVLFATSSPAIRASADATPTIPIVILSVGDPLEAGLIASLARPGGNVTGLSSRASELSVKLLELLKECLPRASRIAVMGGVAVGRWRNEMEVAAHSMGTRLQFVELIDPQNEVDAAFASIAKARSEGLVLLPTLFVAMNPARIAKLALHHRLPTIFWERHFPEAGGLMAYGPDHGQLWQRAGVLVAKILMGSRPSDLPVEQADRFRLVINLKTAKALELQIPQSVLVRADQLIE
jgi:putative ABC transport system substrate-binding protein